MMPLPKVEMTIFETILARRSVRRYKARKVDKTTISTLLEAAIRAPSTFDEAPWAFVIIQDKALLRSLSDLAKPLFMAEAQAHYLEPAGHSLDIYSFDIVNYPDFNIFYDATTLMLICGKKSVPYYAADCWLAAENLMLAACAMGLGTCVIGSAVQAFNTVETKTKLNIPESFYVVAPIVVGFPDDEIIHVMRKNPVILANIQAPHHG